MNLALTAFWRSFYVAFWATLALPAGQIHPREHIGSNDHDENGRPCKKVHDRLSRTSHFRSALPIEQLTGSTLRARDPRFKAQIATAVEQIVWPWFENKAVKPVIHSTFSLRDVAEAHHLMEASEHIGKIILVVDQ